MTAQINHKKLYFNYCTSGNFFNIEIQISGKYSDIPPPPPKKTTLDASLCDPDGCILKPISV
jgi:hypothetical protein